jgi:hypothetical protein
MANTARKVFNNPKLYLTCMAAIGIGLFILGTVATHGLLPAALVPLFITGTAICAIGGALVGGYYTAETKPMKRLLGNQEERAIEEAAAVMLKSEQEYVRDMDAQATIRSQTEKGPHVEHAKEKSHAMEVQIAKATTRRREAQKRIRRHERAERHSKALPSEDKKWRDRVNTEAVTTRRSRSGGGTE